jgi:MFS family permease
LVIIQSLLSTLTITFMGHLSDLYGRRRITAIGCLVMTIFPFLYFGMLDTKSAGLVLVAIVIALPLHDLQYGPQAAFIAENFPGSLRYSGASLGYQLASITAGGPAPIIAAVLLRRFGTSMAIATYMAICSLISLACVYALSERAGRLDHQ